jgi:hypothetical protein
MTLSKHNCRDQPFVGMDTVLSGAIFWRGLLVKGDYISMESPPLAKLNPPAWP